MRNLLLTGMISLMSIAASVASLPHKVNALTTPFQTNPALLAATMAFDDGSNQGSVDSHVDRASEAKQTDEMQVADVGWSCTTYPDGSYVCCIVDSYGNWYCEWN